MTGSERRHALNRSSQAALEFLTTYAWAFLVILIGLGALYYFGVFDFSKFLPQKCVFPLQFECIDYSFVGDEVRVRLINNLGEDITVTAFAITNDASSALSCTVPDTTVAWESGTEQDYVFSDCEGGGFIVSEKSDAKISITYYADHTPSRPEHTFSGKITATVND